MTDEVVAASRKYWGYKLRFAFVKRSEVTTFAPMAPVYAQRKNDDVWEGMIASMLVLAWEEGDAALEILDWRPDRSRWNPADDH